MIPHIALIGKILLIAADLFYHTYKHRDDPSDEPDLSRMEKELRKYKRRELAKKLRKARKLNQLEDIKRSNKKPDVEELD